MCDGQVRPVNLLGCLFTTLAANICCC
jgi:hypothetical protein